MAHEDYYGHTQLCRGLGPAFADTTAEDHMDRVSVAGGPSLVAPSISHNLNRLVSALPTIFYQLVSSSTPH